MSFAQPMQGGPFTYSVAPFLIEGSDQRSAPASACCAMQLSYCDPDSEFCWALGQAPSVQCGIPGGDPLYPNPTNLPFGAITKAAYFFLLQVENNRAMYLHACIHLACFLSITMANSSDDGPYRHLRFLRSSCPHMERQFVCIARASRTRVLQ